jgi:hypothetical protein
MEARVKTRVRNMASKITTTDLEFISDYLVKKWPMLSSGIDLAKELEHQRELMKEGFAQMDKRFEQVDKRFEQVDKRFEQVDKRFTMLTWFVGIITTVIMGFTLMVVKL